VQVPPHIDRQQFRPRWWQLPTVLSLDAPAVSVAWLALLGRHLEIDLRWPEMFVLGASVWLAYAADRFIEGWRLAPEEVRTPRHRFYQRWRGPVAAIWVAVLAADFIVAWTRLGRTEWLAGWALTAAVAAYLLSHQFIHRTSRWRVPKEVCVAGLLTGGIAVFLIGSTPLTTVLPPLAFYGALCFVNCVLISVWERDVDRAHQQSSLALIAGRTAWIHWTPWLLAVLAIAAAVNRPIRLIAACAAASALLLAAVDWLQPRMGWRPARVLADLVLLTPVIPLLLTP
jgi:hypothetical protein